MLPPRLVRRLVLAPMVIVLALGLIVLSPLLLLLALLFGLAGLLRAGRMRNLRLVSFLVVGLTAEIVTLVLLFGLWIVSGFGGRLQTEPYQSRHYAVVRRFLDALYRGAERTYGLRVEIDEPELTGDELAARLTRPIIVLSRHAGPGDSFLLVHHLLSVYGRRPRVVMKAALQFDPSLDVLGNRLPNVFVRHGQTGESIFTDQIERLARGLGPDDALVIFPEGANWTPSRWRRGIRRLEHSGRRGPGVAGPAHAQPAAAPARRDAGRHRGLPGRRRDLRGARRAGQRHCRSVMYGAGFRSIRSSGPGGGGCRSIRCRAALITRRRCSGCTAGGSGSTAWITESRPAVAAVPAVAVTPEDGPPPCGA